MAEQDETGSLQSWGSAPEIRWDSADDEPPLITFEVDGDLKFTVGLDGNSREMLVDSRAVCRASIVFRKMLRGHWVEAQPRTGEWNVRLPEDDAEAFAVLMGIIHIQTDRTPLSPHISEFYEIVKLADKYDMIRILRPVATNWVRKRQHDLKTGYDRFTRNLKLLFIARHLGATSLYEELVFQMAHDAYVDASGRLTEAWSHEECPELESPELVALIKKTRVALFGIVAAEGRALYRTLTNPRSPARRWWYHWCAGSQEEHDPYDPEGTLACTERLLGRLTIYAHSAAQIVPFFVEEAGPPPIPNRSVESILDSFRGISRSFQELPSECDPMYHTLGQIGLKMAKVPIILPDSLRKYMEKQAEEVGLQWRTLKPSRNIDPKKRNRRRRKW